MSVQVCRSYEKLKTFGVGRRCAVALVHITATNPLRPGSDSNLVARAVVTGSAAGGVRAVAAVIARRLVVGATDAATGMDGVVPVVIVIGSSPIPAAVVRFQRNVRPAHAGVLVADDDALASEAQCPHLRRIHILHAPLDDRGITRCHPKVRNRGIFNPTSRSV